MPIAPITGRLRKGLWRDISVALGLGLGAGYAFWYGYHLKAVQRREEYYLKIEQERAQGQAA
ncbi:cytochrome-c oxidase [Tylopilus felleus]